MVLSSKNSALFSDVFRVFYAHNLPQFPPNYRTQCSRRFPSGRLSRRGRIRAIKKLQESAYIYKTMSGRSGWPSRDPIGENGGANLYEAVRNNAIYSIDYLGLKLNCSCANKPVDIAVAAADGDFDSDLRIAKKGQGTIYALINSINMKIDSPSKQCIASLTIEAHGNPTVMDLGNNAATIPANQPILQEGSISPYNASDVFSKIGKLFCFCKPCIIHLLSCNVGLGTIPQDIAKATGCTVMAANGYCYPNVKRPQDSKVVPAIPPRYPAYPGAGSNMIPFTPHP